MKKIKINVFHEYLLLFFWPKAVEDGQTLTISTCYNLTNKRSTPSKKFLKGCSDTLRRPMDFHARQKFFTALGLVWLFKNAWRQFFSLSCYQAYNGPKERQLLWFFRIWCLGVIFDVFHFQQWLPYRSLARHQRGTYFDKTSG